MEIVNWVLGNWTDVVTLVLSLLGAFSIVAKLTPTTTDDEILAKLYALVHTLGLTKKPE